MRVPMDRSLSSHNWSLPVHDQRQTRWINADTRRITLLLTIAQDSKSAATWSLSGSRLATVSFVLFSLFFFSLALLRDGEMERQEPKRCYGLGVSTKADPNAILILPEVHTYSGRHIGSETGRERLKTKESVRTVLGTTCGTHSVVQTLVPGPSHLVLSISGQKHSGP